MNENLKIYNLFTVDSHHKNISLVNLTQNIFQEKHAKTINLNCGYLIVLNNQRDPSQIHHLERQIFSKDSKFVKECHKDACES